MLADLFTALLAWTQENPHWAYLAVFLVAAGESLLVVGLILPGVALMFGFGALVAAGGIELGPTLLWAAAGAVTGDGVSYWIGRHFHQRLRVTWPFNRHGALINRGVAFFHQHGGKSVILARFVGPLRPILPAVAGMLDMPARRFFVANVLSALVWAPVYTLPGVVFGASLGLAAEVAGRLAVLLVVLVTLVWFGLWLVRLVYRLVQPHAGGMLARALDWSRRHPLFSPLTAAVLDPAHPEARGLAVLLLILALASAAFAWLAGGWLVGLNLYVHEALQELRTPVADGVLIFANGLGEGAPLLAVLAGGCAWLALRGRSHAALHWLAASGAALALTRLIDLAAGARAPVLAEILADARFPSWHASLSVAVYGFLAVLVARELPLPRRWMPYVAAALLVIPVGFARLYLGADGLSDVLAGTALGLACVALLGIAYRRHPAHAVGWPALVAISALAVSGALAWWMDRHAAAELARHARPAELATLRGDEWWAQEWVRLPALRHDFRVRDRQALNLQYAGEPSALEARLLASGWRAPTEASAATALLWLAPSPDPGRLPVLPQVHDGVHDVLHLIRASEDGQAHYVLRLWPTRWRLEPGGERLWVGSVAELQLQQRLRLFSYLVTVGVDGPPLATLRADLGDACETGTRRRPDALELVLARSCAGAAPAGGP